MHRRGEPCFHMLEEPSLRVFVFESQASSIDLGTGPHDARQMSSSINLCPHVCPSRDSSLSSRTVRFASGTVALELGSLTNPRARLHSSWACEDGALSGGNSNTDINSGGTDTDANRNGGSANAGSPGAGTTENLSLNGTAAGVNMGSAGMGATLAALTPMPILSTLIA